MRRPGSAELRLKVQKYAQVPRTRQKSAVVSFRRPHPFDSCSRHPGPLPFADCDWPIGTQLPQDLSVSIPVAGLSLCEDAARLYFPKYLLSLVL